METQRQSKQTSIPFVTPQVPKFVAMTKGGNIFCCFMQQTSISFMAGESMGSLELVVLCSHPQQVLPGLEGPIPVCPRNSCTGNHQGMSASEEPQFSLLTEMHPRDSLGHVSTTREPKFLCLDTSGNLWTCLCKQQIHCPLSCRINGQRQQATHFSCNETNQLCQHMYLYLSLRWF